MKYEGGADDPREQMRGELSALRNQIELLQSRLDKGDFLSRDEVRSLNERMGRISAAGVDAASW